jgi:hypothetical protein
LFVFYSNRTCLIWQGIYESKLVVLVEILPKAREVNEIKRLLAILLVDFKQVHNIDRCFQIIAITVIHTYHYESRK